MPDEVIPEDPFTLIYNTFWSMAESDKDLLALVRPGNRIKFVKEAADSDPRKTQSTPGSTPELCLIPDFFVPQIVFGNNQSSMDRTWNWIIRTSDRLLHKKMFPLEYALFKAMAKQRKQLMKLKWEGELLVRNFTVDRGSVSIPNVDREGQNPMNLGWYSVWTMTTSLNLNVRAAD